MIKIGNQFSSSDLIAQITKGLTTSEHISRTNGRLFAGDAGHCARKAVALGVPGQKCTGNASGKLYMAIGTAVGEKISDGLHGAGILCFKEYKIPDVGLNLGGYIDDIIHYEGKIWVLENKTCGDLPNKANVGHGHQAQVYSLITGFPALLLYASRGVADFSGRLKMRKFEVDTSESALRATARTVATAYHYSQAAVLPEVPAYFSKGEHCSFCPLIEMCWGERKPILPAASKEVRELLEERIAISIEMLINERQNRRNGVLKYLSQYGQPAAVKLLNETDWSTL